MPTVGSARRVLAFTMGICAIFDVTGARVFQIARGSLPEPPPRGSRPDPFLAAMETIMAARREVAPLSTAAEGPSTAGELLDGALDHRALHHSDGAAAPTQKIGVTLPA
jgi:hypothetical protein